MRKNSLKKMFASLAVSAVAVASVASMSVFAAGLQEDGTFLYPDGSSVSAEEIEACTAKASLTASTPKTKMTLAELEAANYTIPVTVSIDMSKWTTVNFHLFYDDALKIVKDEDLDIVEKEFGDAVKNLDAKSIDENDTSAIPTGIFFSSGCKAPLGVKGDIYTVNFTVNKDTVKVGDKFVFDLKYEDGARFMVSAENKVEEAYLFSHLNDTYVEIIEEPATEAPATEAPATEAPATEAGTQAGTPAATQAPTTKPGGGSPDTGVAGVAGLGVAAAGLAVAAGAAFVLRKKED